MLGRFAYINENGVYIKRKGAEKVNYGIMLDVRARIVTNSAYVLARALTIAIRYSIVRQQGGAMDLLRSSKYARNVFTTTTIRPNTEQSVLSYPSQQHILMPLLAFKWGLHFTGIAMKKLYTVYAKMVYDETPKDNDGNISAILDSMLPGLHMKSAALKAFVTIQVADGMEACRKACGGHAFLSNSGFGDLLTSYLPFCTLEGTREVLGQQGGRTLLKLRKMQVDKHNTDTYHGKHSAHNSTFGAALEGYLLRSDVALSTILSHINHSTSSALLSPHALYEHVDLLYRRVVLIADRCDEKIVKETKVSVFEYIAQLLPSYSPTASRGHNNQTRAALVRSGQQVG